MGRSAAWGVAAAAVVMMMLPPALPAQVQTLKDFHVADVENLRSKCLPAAEGAAQGYQAESARVGGLAVTKALLIAELGRSFDHLSRSLAGMSDAARAADGRTFGRDIKVDAGITLALFDMHEHLGQLIAYARMNRIVPPWSQ